MHVVLTRSWVTTCGTPVLLGQGLPHVVHLYGFHLRKWWHSCCNTAVSTGSTMTGENTAWLLPRLLCQQGERLCRVRLCYSCHASQQRINLSALSIAPWVSFQSLSLHLVYPGSVNSANRMISDTIGIVSGICSGGEHETPLDGGS